MTNTLTVNSVTLLLLGALVCGDGLSVDLVATPPQFQRLTTQHLNLKCSIRHFEHSQTVYYITISKNDKLIASVNTTTAPTASAGVAGTVTGDIAPSNGVMPYLQIDWDYPDEKQTGEYTCEVLVDAGGWHTKIVLKRLSLYQKVLGLDSLIEHIDEVQNTIDKMQARMDTVVAFTATIPDELEVKAGKTVMFSFVRTTVGGGYDNNTGIFTAPVSGYYMADLHVMTAAGGGKVSFDMKQNDKTVLWVYAIDSLSTGDSASNSVVLKMMKGDELKVVAREASNANKDDSCTFSVNLIAML